MESICVVNLQAALCCPIKKSVFNHLHVLIFTEARKTAGGGSSFWIGDVAGLNPDFLSYSLGKQLLCIQVHVYVHNIMHAVSVFQ